MMTLTEKRPVGLGRINFTSRNVKRIGEPPPKKSKSEIKGLYKESQVDDVYSTYPLKLLVPDYASFSNCKWLYPITYGGGLVEGDDIQLDISVQESCALLVTTQSSTKVYHSVDGASTKQSLKFNVAEDAFLAVLPDPVVPYKNSKYIQKQHVEMTPSSNLVLLDWYTAGRVARGECWEFDSFHSSNQISVSDHVIYIDAIKLHDAPNLSVKESMSNYQILGSLLILGPALGQLCANLQKEYGKPKSYDSKYDHRMFFAISPVSFTSSDTKVSGCVIKFAAESSSQGRFYGVYCPGKLHGYVQVAEMDLEVQQKLLTMLQLSDSSYPTGGFAHSIGFESAHKHKLVCDRGSYKKFVIACLENAGSQGIPFLKAAYSNYKDDAAIKALDDQCHTCLSNHVANRASSRQGKSLVDTASRTFISVQRIHELNQELLESRLHGHIAVMYGVICGALELDLQSTLTMFMYNTLKTAVTSSVRLGVMGPLEAQGTQYQMQQLIPDIIQRSACLSTDEVHIRFPVVDLAQNVHDTMFSKLFYS